MNLETVILGISFSGGYSAALKVSLVGNDNLGIVALPDWPAAIGKIEEGLSFNMPTDTLPVPESPAYMFESSGLLYARANVLQQSLTMTTCMLNFSVLDQPNTVFEAKIYVGLLIPSGTAVVPLKIEATQLLSNKDIYGSFGLGATIITSNQANGSRFTASKPINKYVPVNNEGQPTEKITTANSSETFILDVNIIPDG